MPFIRQFCTSFLETVLESLPEWEDPDFGESQGSFFG